LVLISLCFSLIQPNLSSCECDYKVSWTIFNTIENAQL